MVEIRLTNGTHWRGLCAGSDIEETCSCGQHFGNLLEHELSGTERWFGDALCRESAQANGEAYAHEQGSSKGNKRPYESSAAIQGKAIAALLERWAPSKLEDVRLIPGFEEDYPTLYWDSQKFEKVVDNAWQHCIRKWNGKTFEEICQKQNENPLKYLLSNHIPYYNPEVSAKILGRLILFQSHNVETAIDFVKSLICVMDKVDSKKNTLLIYGPPSCGKSYLINSLLKVIWNEGNIENATKGGSEFTFQEAYNKRATLWNECSFNGVKNCDTAKQIWEGSPTAMQVKYKKGTILTRTPVFVTTNRIPWSMYPNEREAFMDRCFMFTWRRAEWMKKISLKAHPLAWYHILLNYQDVEWWNELPFGHDWWDHDNLAKLKENSFLTECYNNYEKEELEFILKDCNLYSGIQ